ncbi:DUF1428 domain-containing protein [Methylobacterium sp. 13MFTsu3.1M2]|uniref:DUF1428 domain-containing protein n=1 Tax=Methylobacterium sp. 13MFTsu3.1M2 TaxID=1502776 RepID=UPI0008E8E19A|nr:DUF1428 domain-containing protein [Methylobacterium sp. 13MFTsu3.1M2]SFD91300.1 Uncharacterized conserved protein YbaA, DUF1428 family [Methylobacterium sp. 13MFTsu3.1M2]
MTYVSGFVTPVPDANREAYVASARAAWALFREYGALHQMEAWGDNVPEGERTDFRRSVALRDGESVVLGWILWPDRETADRCEAAMRTDPRFRDLAMPFDGARMIFGGFAAVFEASRGAA